VLYAITLGVAPLRFTGLLACLRAWPNLLTSSARPRRVPVFRRPLAGPAVYTAAALIAFVSAPASLALGFVAVHFALLPRHLRRLLRPGAPSQPCQPSHRTEQPL
jgi:hypothetical protein